MLPLAAVVDRLTFFVAPSLASEYHNCPCRIASLAVTYIALRHRLRAVETYRRLTVLDSEIVVRIGREGRWQDLRPGSHQGEGSAGEVEK